MIDRHPCIEPMHPGELLREDILPALDMGEQALANALQIPCRTLREILNEEQSITPGMAVRFRETIWQWVQVLGQPSVHI